MILKENQIVNEIEKYFDTTELARQLDRMADECDAEDAYWLKESAINLRNLFEICMSVRHYKMEIERRLMKELGLIKGDQA